MQYAEYIVKYNRKVTGGYTSDEDVYSTCPQPGVDDGYTGPYGITEAWEAQSHAILRLEKVKAQWPEFNAYPYGEARIYRREVSEWEAI